MTEPDPLSDLLARWQPRPGPAPDFAAGVHARLARSRPRSVAERPASLFARVLAWPASLPLAAALALVLGVASAVGLQRTRSAELMADAYARSIDPVQLAASGAPHGHDHHP